MTEPTHADILRRLDAGNQRFAEMEDTLKSISASLACLPAMESEIAKTREIVEAWGVVKGVGKGIKWFAGIVLAVTAIIVSIKGGIAHVLK